MTQPHYPQMCLFVSECLPLRSPFVFRLYDILIRSARQGVPPSSDGGNRHQSPADDTAEDVPAQPHRPIPPSDARAHQAGVLAPILDGSSGAGSHEGYPAGEPVRQATIHEARAPGETCYAGVVLSRLLVVVSA